MTATLKLYELSTDYLRALDALTAQEELPPEAIADTLDGLAGAWEDKALNVARYVRNLEAEADAIAQAKQRMEARAKATAHHADAPESLSEERTGAHRIDPESPGSGPASAKKPTGRAGGRREPPARCVPPDRTAHDHPQSRHSHRPESRSKRRGCPAGVLDATRDRVSPLGSSFTPGEATPHGVDPTPPATLTRGTPPTLTHSHARSRFTGNGRLCLFHPTWRSPMTLQRFDVATTFGVNARPGLEVQGFSDESNPHIPVKQPYVFRPELLRDVLAYLHEAGGDGLFLTGPDWLGQNQPDHADCQSTPLPGPSGHLSRSPRTQRPDRSVRPHQRVDPVRAWSFICRGTGRAPPHPQ